MSITTAQIVSWVLVGLVAGPLAGWLLKGSRRGYGFWRNLGLGLAGGLVGGVLFSLFGVDFGLGAIRISLADVVRAFLGALFVVVVASLVRAVLARRRASARDPGPESARDSSRKR